MAPDTDEQLTYDDTTMMSSARSPTRVKIDFSLEGRMMSGKGVLTNFLSGVSKIVYQSSDDSLQYNSTSSQVSTTLVRTIQQANRV